MIDLSFLSRPLEGALPGGASLEYDPVYDEIRQATISDPDYLPQGDWSTTLRKADWEKVIHLSSGLLRDKTRDLQLLCWLGEGMCHKYGPDGLQQILTGIIGYMQNCWQDSWPELNDDGLLIRQGIFTRFDRAVSVWLSAYSFSGTPEGSLNHWRRIQAHINQKANESTRSARKDETDDLSLSTYYEWIDTLSPTLIVQAETRLTEIRHRTEQLEEYCRKVASGLSSDILHSVSEVLNQYVELISRLKTRFVGGGVMEESNVTTETHGTVSDNMLLVSSEDISDRQEAIRQIRSLARYFRQTEPSSPVPLLLDRAARWAEMSLTDWLEEVLTDKNTLHYLNQILTGIEKE